MKEYLANILPRIQQGSKKLDHIEAFVEKPWVMFEEGSDELLEYEFYRDGRLLVSIGGNVIWGKWELTPSSQRLLVTYSEKTLLMHSAFINEALMILKRSGIASPSVVFVNQKVIQDLNYQKYLEDLSLKEEQERLIREKKSLTKQEREDEWLRINKIKSEERSKVIDAALEYIIALCLSFAISLILTALYNLLFSTVIGNLISSAVDITTSKLEIYNTNLNLLSTFFFSLIFTISFLLYFQRKEKPFLRSLVKTKKSYRWTVVFSLCVVSLIVLGIANCYALKNKVKEIKLEMHRYDQR